MRILVVGCGKVGYSIAEQLANENHDVVVIDSDEEVIRRTEDAIDVLTVRGNGANPATLIDAGAERSDIIMATTASDEVNMLCCLIAKRLGTRYAIARIRDPEYNESLDLLRRGMDIDLAVNPERATALEISRLLRYPFASTIESFAKGRVEMVAFRSQADDSINNISLSHLQSKHRNLPQVLYAAVERDEEVIIPKGDFIIKPGDNVHVAADLVTITSYFRELGRLTGRIRSVMMLGGGKISYYLAKIIVPMGIHVTIIEINEKKAASLSESLPGCNIIYGDGTDHKLLQEEGIENMDAFIALSDRDEENLMTGLFASQMKVPKVIVKNNHQFYSGILNALGLDSVVSPRAITCSYLLRYVRGRLNASGAKVERLYRIMNGKAETLEFVARAGDGYIGVPLKDLHVRPNALVAVIVRRGKVIVPFGNDHIDVGDRVVVIVRGSGVGDLNEVIRK